MKRYRAIAIVAVALLLAAGCSKSGDSGSAASGSASATMTIGSDTANLHGKASVTGKSSIEMQIANYYFSPTVLTGSPGQQLTLDIKNEGSVTHTFTLPSQSIDMEIQPGQSTQVQVTFPQSGFAEFYCRFHRMSGMAGELTVP